MQQLWPYLRDREEIPLSLSWDQSLTSGAYGDLTLHVFFFPWQFALRQPMMSL